MMRRVIVPALAVAMVLSTMVLPAFGQDETTAVDIACPDGAPDAGFSDVSSSNVHSDAIDCGVELELIFGLTATTFGPQQSLTRGQQVSLLARAMDEAGVELPPLAGSPNFSDIGPPHGDNIRRLAAAGIAAGYPDGTFRTGQPVMRDQTASFFVRALEYILDEEITPEDRNHFSDVRDGVHAANIDAAFEYGIVNGKTDGRYDPRGTTRRDQAATVLINFSALLLEEGPIPDACLELIEDAEPADHEPDASVNGQATLLHDTHVHGKYVQTVGPFGDQVDVDIARYFAKVQERKDEVVGDDPIFLANGDDIGPSVYSGLFEPNGIHMIDALNEAPVDVNTLGNHEFDYGPENLRDIIEAAEYPYVSANVRDRDDCAVFGEDLGVTEFLLFERNGIDIGVTGLAPEGMATITSLGDDTVQLPAPDALDIVVPKMRDAGADVIVVNSHLCGTDAKALADTYEGVDVYAGDHCGVYEEDLYEGETGAVVSLVADEYAFLGELEVTVVGGEVSDVSRTVYSMRDEVADLTPIGAIQTVVDDYDERLDEQLNVVIGERDVVWDTRTTTVRVQETAAGNFFTDVMRTAHGGSDIAVTNSGGIRGNQEYPEGDITRRDIAEIFPFGNRLVQAEISGSTLLEALERSVQNSPDPDGGFLQVSGMSFTYDSSQPAGSRVQSVTIGGQSLDPDRIYTMATNDFTLGGGDDYPMFRDDTRTTVDYNAAPVLDSFIMDYIEENLTDPVTTTVEGRIVDVAD